MMDILLIIAAYIFIGILFVFGSKLLMKYLRTKLIGIPVICYSALLLITMIIFIYRVFKGD